ncbi:MAG TPA: DsrE/DsrF/DrsH-like family protein [Rhodocyclaceae bacterium]|nr:DsrE/DsrF/DrsH-like family protein [Rhodocyclaceae bacterium]
MSSNRISILLTSDKREQLQMAAMIASVGAVSGSEVVVFISMNALQYFLKEGPQRAPAAGAMGEVMERKKVPPFMDLFEQAVELGDAKIFPCSMAMDVLEVDQQDLKPFVGEAMGLTKFLDDAREGQVWSF